MSINFFLSYLQLSEINFKDLFIFHLVVNKDFLASSGVFEDRIIFIILSKFSTDTDRSNKDMSSVFSFF